MTSLSSFATTLNLWHIEDFSIQLLAGILADSSKFYRSFEIPKRRGGARKIDAPYPILAGVQQALVHDLRNRCDVSEHAYAYCRRRSAVMHASSHLGCEELLTVDIENFFGSITRQQIHQTLLESNLDTSYAHIASLVSTLQGVLPQGAPTSPLLSNVVFNALDVRFARLAAHLGIVYTRYADDLAFSGKNIPRNLPGLIDEILSSKGYRLNPAKTMLKVKGAKKIITGVSISTGVPKAPRRFVRSVRAEVHYVEKNLGRFSSLSSIDPLTYERILGKLNYWLQIEPNNVYASRKKEILSEAHQRFLNLSRDFNLEDYIGESDINIFTAL